MMDHTYSVADQETDQPVYTLTTEKEKEPLSSTERKICGRGKLYCAICSNCEGKELDDGRILKMHRIPAEPDPSKTDEKSTRRRKQRKLWIQRIKTVRVDFNLTSSARICSEHFAEGVYKGTVDEIPVRLHLEKPVKKPKIKGRTLRVDHVSNYQPPKDTEATDAVTNALHELGCGPLVFQPSGSSVHNILQNPQSSDSLSSTSKESKKEKKKLKKEKYIKEKKEKKNKEIKEKEEADRMNKRSGQISTVEEERCTVWQPAEMKTEKDDPDHSKHMGREGEERRFQEEGRIKMEMDRGSGKTSRAICGKDFTEGRKGWENSGGENSRGKRHVREEVWERYMSKERVKEKVTRRMEDVWEREVSRSRERRTHVERDEKIIWSRNRGREQEIKMFRHNDEYKQRDVARDVMREKHREVEKTHIWVREKEKVSRRE